MNIWMKRTDKRTAGEIKFCGKVIRRSWRSCFQFELLWSWILHFTEASALRHQAHLFQTNFTTFWTWLFIFCINLNGCTTTVQVVLKLLKRYFILNGNYVIIYSSSIFSNLYAFLPCARNTKDDNISVFWIPFTFIVHTISALCWRMKAF